MDAKRMEYLDHQYVLTIQNERSWYTRARSALLRGSFDTFCTITRTEALMVGKVRGERLHPLDHAYIERELFEQFDQEDRRPAMRGRAYPDQWRELNRAIEAWGQMPKKAESAKRMMLSMNEFFEEISEQIETATHTLAEVGEAFNNAVQETKEINAMSNIPFTTKNYVFGQDVANMTEEQLIAALKKVEGEIANLKGIGAKSKKIEQMIKDAEAGLAKIVEVLDAK